MESKQPGDELFDRLNVSTASSIFIQGKWSQHRDFVKQF